MEIFPKILVKIEKYVSCHHPENLRISANSLVFTSEAT